MLNNYINSYSVRTVIIVKRKKIIYNLTWGIRENLFEKDDLNYKYKFVRHS